MSLIPAFELGLWNAWIFILPIIIISIFGSKILGKRGSAGFSGYSKREKMLGSIAMVIVFAAYAYTIFLPLRLDTSWFYAGFFFYLLGMTFIIVALQNFTTTPVDKPVTNGVYRISRNPQYMGDILTYVGISIVCLSWVFLLVAFAMMILEYNSATIEERILLKQYGDAYREYMNRTPRWIGRPKSEKKE